MAIIYSYPLVSSLDSSNLFPLTATNEQNELYLANVTFSTLVSEIIDEAFNGTDRYIPRFDGTSSLINSAIYEDNGGNIGIGTQVPGTSKLKVIGNGTFGNADTLITLQVGEATGLGSQIYSTLKLAQGGGNFHEFRGSRSTGEEGSRYRMEEYTDGSLVRMTQTYDGDTTQILYGDTVSFSASNVNLSNVEFIEIREYIDHDGDSNTRFGFPANDTFAIDTDGVERMRITSAGKVGIGTDNPQKTLDVNGDARLTGALTINTPDSGYALQLAENDGTEKFQIGVDVSGDLNIYNDETLVIEIKDTTNEVRLLNGANIEVQHTAPVIKAQVDSDNNARIQAQELTGGQLLLEHQEDLNVLFQANGNNGVVGTMGVGTTSPDNTYKLDVRGDIRTTGGIFIGGVTAGNKLDDYEEGEFTPDLTTSGTEPGITTKEGRYTKIGDTVFVEIRIRDFVSEDESNSVTGCTNLPFTVLDTLSSTYVTGSAFGTRYVDNSTYAGRQYVYALDNTTTLTFRNGELLGIGFRADETSEISVSIIYKTA